MEENMSQRLRVMHVSTGFMRGEHEVCKYFWANFKMKLSS